MLFHYFVFDVDVAANYDWIEVNRTTSVDTDGTDTSETYSTSFSSTPDVWTQAQTYSQNGEIGAVAWVDDDKTTSGFNLPDLVVIHLSSLTVAFIDLPIVIPLIVFFRIKLYIL